MKKNGVLLISLDFELYWGVRDVRKLDDYRRNLLGVRRAVPAMLDLFERYDIHATWAVVGFLHFRNKNELLAGLPEKRPEYTDRSLCPYDYLPEIGEDEISDPCHYAPSLIELIAARSPQQEIGTHTLSHYYCIEAGQNAETFRHDLAAAIRIGGARNLDTVSLVFPRNQVNTEYLDLCGDLGITSYRGVEDSWLYVTRNQSRESLFRRGLRLLDACVNLTGHHCYTLPERNGNGPVNLPSSRFLRPVTTGFKAFSPLHLNRITGGLEHAAKTGQIYHLWWHPHNFGADPEGNVSFLQKILDRFNMLRDSYGMRSLNMRELAFEAAGLSENGS
ncbi:MAG: polysaccharide deacetylase family protein [Acidobacteriota bacterium]|nr:MAG: polysaccharide deacetylase family protein [Acidobacteriota bacterium]